MNVTTLLAARRLCLAGVHHNIPYELDHVVDSMVGTTRLMLIFRSRPQTPQSRIVLPFLSSLIEIKVRDVLEQDLADLAAVDAPERNKRA